MLQQDYIPVGCIPPARGGGCLVQGVPGPGGCLHTTHEINACYQEDDLVYIPPSGRRNMISKSHKMNISKECECNIKGHESFDEGHINNVEGHRTKV